MLSCVVDFLVGEDKCILFHKQERVYTGRLRFKNIQTNKKGPIHDRGLALVDAVEAFI
jgi:hypothetical protein